MSDALNAPPNVATPPLPEYATDEWTLRRLRWPLFQTVTDVMVMDDAGDPQSQLRPLLDPLQPHPLASEPATNPPRPRMLVTVDMISGWDYWQDSEQMDSKPKPLVIENADGSPITIGQLVAQVHEYVGQFRSLLNEVFSLPRRSQMQFYFDGFLGINTSRALDPDVVFPLMVQEDDGKMESHWAQSALRVQRRRQNIPPPSE